MIAAVLLLASGKARFLQQQQRSSYAASPDTMLQRATSFGTPRCLRQPSFHPQRCICTCLSNFWSIRPRRMPVNCLC